MSSQGILYVTVIEASNLTGKDMIGKNDPYVELWIDERYKQKTRVIKNNDNPLWNQTFTFPLEGNDHKIHVKVFDKDIIGKDTIGEAKIDFSSACQGHPLDTWTDLTTKMGLNKHGKLHVYIEFKE